MTIIKTRAAVSPPAIRLTPLYWLALGTFAVGTEAFMIAAILPKIATDFAVSLQATAQLVTIFALTYALSSPVLTALSGSFKRRKLLMLAMAAFAGANLIAATASTYWSLAFARFLLAVFAGLYTPSATALAGALVPPERRAWLSRLSQVNQRCGGAWCSPRCVYQLPVRLANDLRCRSDPRISCAGRAGRQNTA